MQENSKLMKVSDMCVLWLQGLNHAVKNSGKLQKRCSDLLWEEEQGEKSMQEAVFMEVKCAGVFSILKSC